MKENLTFTVPFNKRKQSFRVTIWYDVDAFEEKFDPIKKQTVGNCDPIPDRYVRSGPFAAIDILWDYFELDTVVHECMHLLVDWIRSRHMQISIRNEERVAYLFDEITRNFWSEYERAKKR